MNSDSWCVKCAKYLAFGTFETADDSALSVIAKMGRSIIPGSLIWFDEVNQAQVRSPVFAHVFS